MISLKNNFGIKIIYLDMDGFFVNQMQELAEREGFNDIKSFVEYARLHSTKDMDYIFNAIEKHIDSEPFLTCKPHWDVLGYLKGMIPIWQANGIDPCILSSLTDGESVAGKICIQKNKWLDFYLPNDISRIFVRGGSEKAKFANEQTVLIDDFEKNCDRFSKAGGWAIYHNNLEKTIGALTLLGLHYEI